jgi:hypothetical protein
LVGGCPLIAYTIDSALGARHLFHRVVVSTDDEEIASVTREHAPGPLAGDNMPTLPVLLHTVRSAQFDTVLAMDNLHPQAHAKRCPDSLDVDLIVGDAASAKMWMSCSPSTIPPSSSISLPKLALANNWRLVSDRPLQYCLNGILDR